MIAMTPSHHSSVSTTIPNRVAGKPVSQKELRNRMGLDDDKEPQKKAEKRKSNSNKSEGKKFTKKAKNLQGATINPYDVATDGKFCCLLKSCPVINIEVNS